MLGHGNQRTRFADHRTITIRKESSLAAARKKTMTTLTATKLNPRVVEVTAHDDLTLTLTFGNGEKKRFDMKPYVNRSEFFRELQNRDYFLQARPDLGTVVWPHGQDLCPDTLYLDGVLEEDENL